MKLKKQQKNVKPKPADELDLSKPKKKMAANNSKVNVKSIKFWDELYDNEGDEIEKYLR